MRLTQQAGLVGCQQRVPIGAPDDLDDIPAGALEGGLEFLDYLAVAAHGAIEALQVAVHHPDEVVQIFPGGQRQRAEGLGLVGLAVADEGPDLRFLAPA